MKYLTTFLNAEERVTHSREPEPPKPQKPVVAVSAGANVREEERFHSSSWRCPHCGQPVKIEDVFPSPDQERTLTMWSCEPCQTVAVTPDTIKEPPTVWVKRVMQ